MAKIKIMKVSSVGEDVEQPGLSEHAAVGTVFGTALFICLTETGQMLTRIQQFHSLGIGPTNARTCLWKDMHKMFSSTFIQCSHNQKKKCECPLSVEDEMINVCHSVEGRSWSQVYAVSGFHLCELQKHQSQDSDIFGEKGNEGRHEEDFWGAGNVLSLDLGTGYTGVCLAYENSSRCSAYDVNTFLYIYCSSIKSLKKILHLHYLNSSVLVPTSFAGFPGHAHSFSL